MSSVKRYGDKNLELRYHPEEGVLDLRLKSGRKDLINRLEDKIKTVLSVSSSKIQPNGSRIIQLDKQTPEGSVSEFLQTVLGGGEEYEDAESEGTEAAKEEQEQPQPPIPSSAEIAQTQQLQPEVQPESFTPLKAFNMLWESTYRTGDYWNTLTQASGKGRQQLQYVDILSLRRLYTKKKKSESRDRVLRALDRAARYFIRTIRKTNGNELALSFKEKYKTIGKLTPYDYGEEDGGVDGVDSQGGGEEFNPQSVDFSQFFPNKEDEEEKEVPEFGQEEYPE